MQVIALNKKTLLQIYYMKVNLFQYQRWHVLVKASNNENHDLLLECK